MFHIGDKVELDGKQGHISWLHDFTTYNGSAKGERTAATIRFDDGQEHPVYDIYRSHTKKI